MKHLRLTALLLALALCLTALAACGTSSPSVEDSLIPDSDWEDLLTPSPSPQPELNTVMPELEPDSTREEGRDITSDYKSSLLGEWITEDGSKTYEFKSDRALVITDTAAHNYTYAVREEGKATRLCIISGEEEQVYNFSRGNNSLTLYDVASGDMVEKLHRKEAEAAATPAKTASPTAAPSAKPSASAAPTASPSASPSTAPSAEPSGEPEPEITEVPEPDVGAARFTAEVVLEVMADGFGFSPTDPGFFWAAVARYLSRNNSHAGDSEYFNVSFDAVDSAARALFGGDFGIPAPPAGGKYATEVVAEDGTTSYDIRFGEVDYSFVVHSADSATSFIMQSGDGSKWYQVEAASDGSIISVTAISKPN